jgi:hypothetical protein
LLSPQAGNTSYNSFVTNSVSGQLTSLAGGIAGAIYDGNYQMGAYGASQVFTYNDSNVPKWKKNSNGTYDLYDLDEGSGYLIYVGTVPDLTFNAPITFDPRYLTQGPFYNGEPRDDFTQATQGGGAFIQITGGVPLGAQLIYSDGQTSYLPGDFAGSYKELVTGGLIDYSHAGSVIYLPAAYSGEGGLFTAYQTDQSIRSFDSGVAGLVNGFLVLGAGVTVPGLGGDLAPSGMGAGPESEVASNLSVIPKGYQGGPGAMWIGEDLNFDPYAPQSEPLGNNSPLLSGANNTPTITAAPYGDLSGTLPEGFQANHLNQDAAFRDVIPSEDGLSIGMKGNAFTEPGTPHYDFHASLEQFWDQYRPGGSLFGDLPTNGDYHQALQEALQAGGFSPEETAELANQAAQQRLQFGLPPDAQVPRVPGRLPQKQPVTNDASTNSGNTQ